MPKGIVSNRNDAAFDYLREPTSKVSHGTGLYGYQYADGMTILNTSRWTAEHMANAWTDIVAFSMRTWRKYNRREV